MLTDPTLPPNIRLAVADSFRTRSAHNGHRLTTEARGWELHRQRFSRSVTAATPATNDAPAAADIAAFLDQAAAAISAAGAGFPRLELWHNSADEKQWQMRLALRDLPTLGESLHTVLAAGVPVVHPERKGPNIETFQRLNSALGCEALLVQPDLSISEGTTTSVLWWEDDVLCRSASENRVASVAETLVSRIAAETGHHVQAKQLREVQLRTHTAWAVNALHGIRPITHLGGETLNTPQRVEQLQQFRALLDQTWQTVQ